MSLVGPRPEVPAFVCLENEVWQRVLQTRPGITDHITLTLRNEQALLASIGQGHENFYRQVLQPYKLRGYVGYQRVRDWKSDLRILVKTLVTRVCFSQANTSDCRSRSAKVSLPVEVSPPGKMQVQQRALIHRAPITCQLVNTTGESRIGAASAAEFL